MNQLSESNNRIRISPKFFCDGHCYVLTSSSLGGSDITLAEISDSLFNLNEEKTTELIKKGVCFPVCFVGDCALDGNTLFVLGKLNEEEERNWIARISWKLNIPCGKFIVCCGCLEEDLEPALSLSDQNSATYQILEVSPAEYLVEIYAYFSSMTVQNSLNRYDQDWNLIEDSAMKEWYLENRPGIKEVDYLIRLKPLETEPEMPKQIDGWFEDFTFRD